MYEQYLTNDLCPILEEKELHDYMLSIITEISYFVARLP